MPGIARGNIDFASSHSNGDTHTAPVETIYVGNPASKVFVNGFHAVAQLDQVGCGEKALGCSSTVFIGGKGVHRLNDRCDSHAFQYTPSFCEQASANVSAGG